MTRNAVGFFNPVHPSSIQVLGEAGTSWLAKLAPKARAALPRQLRARGLRTLMVADGGKLADQRRWAAAGIAVEHWPAPDHELVHALRREAASRARRVVLHGTLLHVHGTGVLVEGPAGAGKSALALELLARGHALVADDAVEVARPGPGILVGRSPAVIHGYLETRGLGVLDVRRMHGARALRASARLDLVVRLERGRARALKPAERLHGRRGTRRVFGEALPVLSLPQSWFAKTGHNLAVLVEAACLDRRLQLDGADAPAMLERRQARAIRRADRKES